MGSINNIRCVIYTFVFIYSFNNFGTTYSSNLDHTSGHLSSSRGKESCIHVKSEFPLLKLDAGDDINNKGN